MKDFTLKGRWRSFALSTFFSLLIIFPALAQNKVISGVVTDAQSNEAIIGASVKVKGTSIGTATDVNGAFKLAVPQNAILIISSLDYVTVNLPPVFTGVMTVKLSPAAITLNDVVVMAYATQKKATVTGAVDQISSKQLENKATTNLGLSLQGAAPGLLVTRSSPRPGNEGLAFQIRGFTSVNGGTPLIVIDGVPALNTGVSFQNLNYDDVESISVLKDGAAAIYGARAANGVILVTTKKGKAGKTQFNYSANMRFTKNGITSYSPSMQQYATMWIEANKEEAVPNWWGWVSQDNMLKMQQGIEGIYHTQYWGDIFLGNANRINEMFSRHYSYQNNLSISGGTDQSAYRISLLYADNKGNLATAYDGQKQYNLRMNYDNKLTDRVKLATGVSLINAVTSSPSVGLDAALFAQEMPFFPAKNPYGQWYADYGTVGDRQPVAATADGGRDNVADLITRIDETATINLFKDLDLEGKVSLQDERYNEERWVTLVQTYDWFGNPAQKTITATQTSQGNPGYRTVANETFYQYYSALLRYNKSISGKHNISAVAGINAEKTNYQNESASRLNFVNNGVTDLNAADPTTVYNSGGKTQNGFYSYLARLNYNYNEKYLLELLGRDDGASQFDYGFKFKQFGSASLGWVFTKEDIFKSMANVVDFGKIRASYGVSGNNAGIQNFDYVTGVNSGTGVLGQPPALSPLATLANNGLTTNIRTWERVSMKNIGIDLAFLNSRLTSTFELYQKQNNGMLIKVVYPSIIGAMPPTTNNGQLNVNGWEATFNWKDHIGQFNYNLGFNIGNSNSLIKRLDGANTFVAGKNPTVNGYPINAWFVYQTDGYFQSQAEVDDYYNKYKNGGGNLSALPNTNASATLRPGDTKIVDLNGDGIITRAGGNVNNNTSDLKFVGDANPHYQFGINLGGSWKGFDFDLFFQGIGKQLIQRSGYMAYPFSAIYLNQNPKFLGQTWTSTHTDAPYPRLTVNSTRAAWDYANNDFMLQNNRYIRLKNLIIGYTIPKSIVGKVGLQKVRFYFSGNDLWESTSIKDGYDPEMGETSQNVGYPFYRTLSFGLNVGF